VILDSDVTDDALVKFFQLKQCKTKIKTKRKERDKIDMLSDEETIVGSILLFTFSWGLKLKMK